MNEGSFTETSSLQTCSEKLFQHLLSDALAADQGSGQIMECLEVSPGSFVADFESAVIAEPTQCSFHDVSCPAQSTAMSSILRQGHKHWLDAQAPHQYRRRGRAIARVALKDRRLGSRAPSGSLHRRHAQDHGLNYRIVARVRRCRSHDQRQPWASVSRWRLQPDLARSVGFGPVWSPQKPRGRSPNRSLLAPS